MAWLKGVFPKTHDKLSALRDRLVRKRLELVDLIEFDQIAGGGGGGRGLLSDLLWIALTVAILVLGLIVGPAAPSPAPSTDPPQTTKVFDPDQISKARGIPNTMSFTIGGGQPVTLDATKLDADDIGQLQRDFYDGCALALAGREGEIEMIMTFSEAGLPQTRCANELASELRVAIPEAEIESRPDGLLIRVSGGFETLWNAFLLLCDQYGGLGIAASLIAMVVVRVRKRREKDQARTTLPEEATKPAVEDDRVVVGEWKFPLTPEEAAKWRKDLAAIADLAKEKPARMPGAKD